MESSKPTDKDVVSISDQIKRNPLLGPRDDKQLMVAKMAYERLIESNDTHFV